MIPIRAVGATDTGQVRANNQDSYHVGDSVFAVADGMGGHLAGEVASETALEPVAELDGRVFPDQDEASSALEEAVTAANRLVSTKAASDAGYRGMGTTLTVALFEGRRMHLGHVGDSRAYLLRGDDLTQLTTDHTLVQHLIDEGQITREEAATHPQRSIVTRAIGVSRQVEVDVHTLEVEDGDQLLLCSDGLTGHVSDEDIAAALREGGDGDQVVDTLIAKANAAGGSDNITAVLLRFGEPAADRASEDTAAAAASGSRDGDTADDLEQATKAPVLVRSSDGGVQEGDWAGRLGRFGSLGRGDDADTTGPSTRRRWPAVTAAIVLVLVLGVLGGRWLLSRSYYVGVDQQQVVIYQGVPVSLGPVELSWVVERSSLSTEVLPGYYVTSLRDGIPAIDRRDARLIIEGAPRDEGTPPPSTTDGASP